MAYPPDAVSNAITQNEFTKAVTSNNYELPTLSQYSAFMDGLAFAGISTRREAAMVLAQILHVSAGLRLTREIVPNNVRCGRCGNGSCSTCYAYLGEQYRTCIDPTEGCYYGRGYIQLSGSANYRAASQDLKLGDQLVEDPDLVANNERLCWMTAFSHWRRVVHPCRGVARGEFSATTRAMKGAIGKGHADEPDAKARFKIYTKVYRAFKIAGKPVYKFGYSRSICRSLLYSFYSCYAFLD